MSALLDFSIKARAIARPTYDNRRLGNMVDWITDNFAEAKRYYHELPGTACWDDEATQFLRCQYESQVLARYV